MRTLKIKEDVEQAVKKRTIGRFILKILEQGSRLLAPVFFIFLDLFHPNTSLLQALFSNFRSFSHFQRILPSLCIFLGDLA